jgi:molybdenum cofactor synthesis domain-containing protein
LSGEPRGSIRVAILTISDRSFRREREDRGGPAVRDAVLRHLPGARIVDMDVLPDEKEPIGESLRKLADSSAADLVLTTGGTGLSPRDVTPQATIAVADYEVPGLGEAMRAASRAAKPVAVLSRQTAVVRRRTLIVNLPGSPRGAVECLESVVAVLPHALATLAGAGDDHPGAGDDHPGTQLV